MSITFLGTNGWYDTDTGNTICFLLKTDEHAILFDAGNGFAKVMPTVPGTRTGTAHLLLNHADLDQVQAHTG